MLNTRFSAAEYTFHKSRKKELLRLYKFVSYDNISITIFSNKGTELLWKCWYAFSSLPKRKFCSLHTFSNSCCHLCLQVENSSDLLFRLAPEGWTIMWYFSLKQRLHFLFDGLNFFPLSMIFQFKVYLFHSSFSFQIWDERVVLWSSSLFLKLLVCP